MALSLNGSTGISGIDGHSGVPAIKGADADTGIFFGTDTASISTAGANRFHITSTGLIGVGTSSPAGGLHVDAASGVDGPVFDSGGTANANHALLVRDSSNNQLLRVNNNGKVGIGTQSPTSLLDIQSSTSGVTINATSTATPGESALFITGKNSSGVSRTGIFKYDSADLFRIGTSQAVDIRFETSDAERLRILSTGGLTFNGDTATANALDDYEEGSWSPALNSGGTVNIYSATYVKIGRLVTANMYISVASIPNNATQFQVGGLPFSGGISNNYGGGSITYTSSFDSSVMKPIVQSLGDFIYFHRTDGVQTVLANSSFTGLSQLLLQVAYMTVS